MFLIWTLISFLAGALPFAVWIGRYGLKKDITQYGDRNPGATNVLRAGGFAWFSVALALDISKGAAPVGMAYYVFGWQDLRVVPIALAPLLGHTFSPFFGWRGGKAIAAAFGTWIGLTLWQVPLVALTSLTILTLAIAPSGWAVMGAMGVMLGALLLWLRDPVLLAVWATHMPLLMWNHRADLRRRPGLRRRKGKDEAQGESGELSRGS